MSAKPLTSRCFLLRHSWERSVWPWLCTSHPSRWTRRPGSDLPRHLRKCLPHRPVPKHPSIYSSIVSLSSHLPSRWACQAHTPLFSLYLLSQNKALFFFRSLQAFLCFLTHNPCTYTPWIHHTHNFVFKLFSLKLNMFDMWSSEWCLFSSTVFSLHTSITFFYIPQRQKQIKNGKFTFFKLCYALYIHTRLFKCLGSVSFIISYYLKEVIHQRCIYFVTVNSFIMLQKIVFIYFLLS